MKYKKQYKNIFPIDTACFKIYIIGMESIERDPTPLSAEDIENLKIELQKTLEADLLAQSEVSLALNDLNKTLAELRHQTALLNQKRQELRSAMDKSRYTISIKRLKVKRLEAEFWQNRHGLAPARSRDPSQAIA